MTARLPARPASRSAWYAAAVAGSARSTACAATRSFCWYLRPSSGLAALSSMISCRDRAPERRPARKALRSRLSSRPTMPGGLGLGVPTVTVTVVAPSACRVATASG